MTQPQTRWSRKEDLRQYDIALRKVIKRLREDWVPAGTATPRLLELLVRGGRRLGYPTPAHLRLLNFYRDSYLGLKPVSVRTWPATSFAQREEEREAVVALNAIAERKGGYPEGWRAARNNLLDKPSPSKAKTSGARCPTCCDCDECLNG